MSRFAMMFAAFIVAAPLPAFADEPETPPMTSSAAQSSPDWAGNWTRMELAGADSALQPLPAAAKLIFEVDKDLRVSLSVGCNRIGTQIVPGEASAVTFAPGIATQMACPGEIDEVERRLADAIEKVTGYETRGEDVVFLDATGKALMLIGR